MDFYPGNFAERQPYRQEWLAEYEEMSSHYAVCKLVKSFGGNEMTDEAREIVTIHDRYVLDERAESLA